MTCFTLRTEVLATFKEPAEEIAQAILAQDALVDPQRTWKILPPCAPNTAAGIKANANASWATKAVVMPMLQITTPMVLMILDSGKSTPWTGALAVLEPLLAMSIQIWTVPSKFGNGVAKPLNYGPPAKSATHADNLYNKITLLRGN